MQGDVYMPVLHLSTKRLARYQSMKLESKNGSTQSEQNKYHTGGTCSWLHLRTC